MGELNWQPGQVGGFSTRWDVFDTNQATSQNSTSNNDHIGIDFNARTMPFPNDRCDNDANGGNYLQNHPVISSAVSTIAGTVITGTLDNSPKMTYTGLLLPRLAQRLRLC